MEDIKIKDLMEELNKCKKVYEILEKDNGIINEALIYLEQFKENKLKEIIVKQDVVQEIMIGKKDDTSVKEKDYGKENNVKLQEEKLNKEHKKKNANKKEKEDLKKALKLYNSKDSDGFKKLRFREINLNQDIVEKWYTLSSSKKNKVTKLELNLIYNVITNNQGENYMVITKEEIIKIIDDLIKDIRRKEALKNSKV